MRIVLWVAGAAMAVQLAGRFIGSTRAIRSGAREVIGVLVA